MNSEPARRGSALSGHIKHILLCGVCVLALGGAMTIDSPPAAAKIMFKHKPTRKQPQHASKLPFGEIPKGPLEIIVSIEQQKLHFYSGGVHIADEPVATGVPGHLTPLGVFSVIQRDRYHHSNIYDNAPMPFMERITWSGVALHEGPGVGHQASHGCIRMPADFAARLWMLPTMGMRVIIAGPELRPLAFADAHLFVHQDAPPKSAPAPTPASETAQKVDSALRTDLVDPPVDAPPSGSLSRSPKADPANDPPADATRQPAKQPTLAEIAKAAAVDATTQRQLPEFASAAATSGATSSASSDPLAAPINATQATTAGAPTMPAGIAAPNSVDEVPLPPSRPAQIGKGGGPIAIFVSRQTSKIYVRQDFTPVFDAPVKIEHPDQPFGTQVFTAMDYLPDHSTFRWTVVTLPGAQTKTVERWKYVIDAYGRHRRVRVEERATEPLPPPETPQEALARIEIPQDVIDQISQLIVPGSSLIVSDQGLGPETGSGTDFIVITR